MFYNNSVLAIFKKYLQNFYEEYLPSLYGKYLLLFCAQYFLTVKKKSILAFWRIERT